MLIFDAHIDTLSLLLTSSRISRPRQTLAGAEGHVNLEYLRQGNIGAQFWAAFVHPRSYNGLALHDTLEKIDFFWTMLDDYPDYLTFAGSAQDIRAAQATGRWRVCWQLRAVKRWRANSPISAISIGWECGF